MMAVGRSETVTSPPAHPAPAGTLVARMRSDVPLGARLPALQLT